MRMGPGKHLRGLTLMDGIVKPEEFDYFHEVRSNFHYNGNEHMFKSLAYNHARACAVKFTRLRRW